MEGAGGSSNPASRADQVVRLVRMGDPAGAEKLAQPILTDLANTSTMAMFKVLVALNRADSGFAELERRASPLFAGEFGFGRGLEVALRPVFDPVREDPRFLRQIELAGVLAEYRAAWTQVLTWSRKAEGQP